MMDRHYLAVDLGAESGRVMLGTLGKGRVRVEEIHRFPNVAVSEGASLRWNAPALFSEIKTGLRKAAAAGKPISGVSCDAWGLDYVLLRGGEAVEELPFHYRDARTEKAMEQVFARVPADDIFAATGIQFMGINTLYHMHAEQRDRPGFLDRADRFLNIGDYFNYLLSGVPSGEITVASGTQLFDNRRGDWAWDLIARLGFPRRIFPPLVPPGTLLGPLRPDIAEVTGLREVRVIATCSHDTAAAVAAAPGSGGDWAFLSSGTWSLLGVELPAPLIDAGSRKYNFTNEAGDAGTTMFRKNIVGLWIVQECKRAWASQGRDFSYDALTALAGAAQPFRSLIRPEDPRFGKPGDMPGKVADYCRETGQPVPVEPGAVVRCALESLALLYAKTLEECALLAGRKFRVLHVVGGGSRNALLNRLTAGAMQLPVVAGPAEATALGNILVQARTLGHIGGDLRAVIRASFPLETFAPEGPATWQGMRERFADLPMGVDLVR